MTTRMTQTLAIGLVVLAAVLPAAGGAQAGETWLCAVATAVAVDEDGTVGPPDLGEKERPTFFRLDAVKKELTLLAPDSRRGEVTKLETVHRSEGVTVFSGVENDRGVTVVITDEGRLTLSIIADGVVWSVFGHAMREEQAPSLRPVQCLSPSASDRQRRDGALADRAVGIVPPRKLTSAATGVAA